ncbi:hypothetical protein BJV82DRAFT_383044 [Fennellomyces sp. T-0311]|nr:hypothetical protein BJV82DRAFT_383044 [Fennellomyces sp. T-0311]
MYSGHFSLALVFRQWFPTTSPYILCVGVGFLDIAFGLLAWNGLEGFYKRQDVPHGPLGNVGLRCDYTHSLVGSLLLSTVYGYATGSLIPGFIAAWSHFVTDWIVHTSDLFFDPFSKIVVGGTGLWDSYPTGSFVLEGLLCLAAGIYAPKDAWSLGASIAVFVSHLMAPSTVPQLYAYILSQDDITRQRLTSVIVTALFLLPGLLMGYALDRADRSKYKKAE